MNELKKKDAALAWGWVLEALASMKEVEASLLQDLMAMAPDLPDDLKTKVNERIALKCLEELFIPLDAPPALPSTSNPTHDSKFSFDFSESCETVLHRIRNETPKLDLKMGGAGLLKWDVVPFIRHKRASMPKCALGQIKDSILDGSHPYADFLLKQSGLKSTRASVSDRVAVSDNGGRFRGSCSNAENVRVEGNDASVLGSKRKRIDLEADNVGGEDRNRVKEAEVLRRNAKKVRFAASVEHNSVTLPQRELLGDSSEREVHVFESERRVLGEYNLGTRGNPIIADDGPDDFTTSERCGQNGEDTIRESQLESPCVAEGNDSDEHRSELRTLGIVPSVETQQKSPQKKAYRNSENGSHGQVADAASADGPRQETVSGGAKELTNCRPQSSDSHGFNNEETDVAGRTREFLNSKCTTNRAYSFTNDWIEENLCMKCNEGGQLLICSTTDCPMVYHEKCLGSQFICYDKGNFYCPLCSHALALKDYREAKEKSSLLKKNLDAFMCTVLEHRHA